MNHFIDSYWSTFVKLICYCLLFVGCEEDIDLKLPPQDKLVVLSNFAPDSLFRLYLSTTVPITGNDNNTIKYPENAKIQLFEDDHFVQDFIFQAGTLNTLPYYFINIKPKTEVVYSISATVTGYPSVKSNNTIPVIIPIEHIELTSSMYREVLQVPGLKEYSVKTELIISKDNSDAEYFHLKAWRNIVNYYVLNSDTIKEYVREELPILISDEFQHADIMHEPGILFEYQTFQEKPGYMAIDFLFFHHPDFEIKAPIYMELRHINRDYFLFHKTVGEQEVSNLGESILSTQSVLIHNNIEDGVGNFSGYSVSIDSVSW